MNDAGISRSGQRARAVCVLAAAVLAVCGAGTPRADGTPLTHAAPRPTPHPHTVRAARPAPPAHRSAPSGGPSAVASPSGRPAAAPTATVRSRRTADLPAPADRFDRALAAVRATTTGHLSVAVADLDRGTTATYAPDGHAFVTASIAKADILATLMLRAQDAGTQPTADDRAQAVKMIEASDNEAADALWRRIGGGAGLAAANARFGLRQTVPGPGGQWGLTTTTAADQLRLLGQLTSAASPLTAASRAYVLGLMEHVRDDQDWGVPAAAAPGTVSAVKNGWLPRSDTGLWVVNSIGVVRRDAAGHRLLVAVLSDGQPTYEAGVALVQSAATTAARALG